MNGIIYCRVSSKEQVEGTSLESQEIACREYADRNKINVERVYIEKGESAKFADRPQLLELLEFCRDKQNDLQVLLVWKIDRLARNVGDHFNIKASLLKQGVRVVSVTEPIDSNPEGKLLETILAGFAQFDNDLRATRTIQGMRRKIQEGIFPWKPPLGYKTITQPGTKKTEPDQPDEPTFSLLQRAWNEFATGAYTKAEMLRLMRRWNLQTKAGEAVSNQSLNNMFRDPFYAGIIRDPWAKQDYPGQHLAMVSAEVFAKVQEVISRRNRSLIHQKIRPEFPLRMFARCHACSHYLTGSSSRGRSKYYAYYHCFNQFCESGNNEPSSKVHDEFAEFLGSFVLSSYVIERFSQDLIGVIRKRKKDAVLLQEKQQAELRRIAEQQKRLVGMRTDNLITSEEFAVHRELLEKRQAALYRGSQTALLTEKILLNDIEKICEPLRNLKQTWNDMEPEFKQRFQRLILPSGFVIGKIGTAE